jgi:hypothetical protein
VYDVDDKTMFRLDRLEDVPFMYAGRTIRLSDGEVVLTYLGMSAADRGRPYPKDSWEQPPFETAKPKKGRKPVRT